MKKSETQLHKNSRWGWLFVATGLFIMAMAAGFIPVDKASFHAPRWIVTVCGCVFGIAGLMIIMGPQSGLNNFMVALLLFAMGLTGGWVALFGGASGFSGGIPFAPREFNTTLARLMFGVGALFCLLMSGYALKMQYKQEDQHETNN